MRRSLPLLAAGVLFPIAVLALDYTDHSSQYTDAPFPRPEAAGISLLTSVGAVEGNPDGTFAPDRTLNRAEFTKIVLLSHPKILVANNDAANCFPDVKRVDWFSKYVCMAKKRGMVGGYPDGLFRPDRPVNYAEALKILSELYRKELAFPSYPCTDTTVVCEVTVPDTAPWYEKYAQWAMKRKLHLAMDLPYDAPLTRGQMARLAAAFRAESEGELALYRRVESGQIIRSSSSSAKSTATSRSSSSVSSSVISSAVSSMASSSASVSGFPARSHFLLLGERTGPILSGTFFASQEPIRITGVTVKLKREITSIETMYLVDAAGTTIMQLSLDIYDADKKTWKATQAGGSGYLLPEDVNVVLGVDARIKGVDSGGSSDVLVETDSITVTGVGVYSTSSYTVSSSNITKPKHQTARGRITSVVNAGDEEDILVAGNDQILGEFAFAATTVGGALLRVEHLEFAVSKSSTVTVAGWEVGIPESPDRHSCSVSAGIVSCLSIPAGIGMLSNNVGTIRLYGDVSIDQGASNVFLQVSLSQPGTVGENGAVRWTDETGHFTWIEADSPVARGTVFE